MSLPNYVSNNLLEEVLREHLKDKSLKIIDVETKAAVPVGDNYTSVLLRSNVFYKSSNDLEAKSTSLIIKCSGDTEQQKTLLKDTGIFEIEIDMFENILPQMRELLNKNGRTKNYLAAECLKSQSEPKFLLIMQDLKPFGYQLASRRNGLDLDHCLLVLDRIAKFHAASAVLYQKNPKLFAKFNKGLYTNRAHSQVMRHFVTAGFKSLINATSQWPGCKIYADKLKKIESKIFEKSINSGIMKTDDFNVLNHGDLWINNIMFRYEQNEKPVDLRFVDFQLSIFSTPVLDLQYFFHTSTTLHVYKTYLPTLQRHYHSQLTQCLKDLNYPAHKMPHLEDILKDYQANSWYGVLAATTVLPLVKAPKRDDSTYDDLILNTSDEEGGVRHATYNSEGFRQMMEYLLPLFDEEGLFE